jgi:NAD-dependent deacetylase
MSIEPIISQSRGAAILNGAGRIVVFSGAGVSAESGVPTFRDPNGLWEEFPPEQFANWNGILNLMVVDPVRVAQFLVALLRPILLAQPNAAHLAIADLEKKGKAVIVVTQNIDRLHQRAGSTTVLEVHGTIFEVGYIGSEDTTVVSFEMMNGVLRALEHLCLQQCTEADLMDAVSPLAGRTAQGLYLPRVVLFGDDLPRTVWANATSAVSNCDCMIVVGTSQLVWPAASLPNLAKASGATIIGVGPDPIESDVWLRGSAGALLPQLLGGIAVV